MLQKYIFSLYKCFLYCNYFPVVTFGIDGITQLMSKDCLSKKIRRIFKLVIFPKTEQFRNTFFSFSSVFLVHECFYVSLSRFFNKVYQTPK